MVGAGSCPCMEQSVRRALPLWAGLDTGWATFSREWRWLPLGAAEAIEGRGAIPYPRFPLCSSEFTQREISGGKERLLREWEPPAPSNRESSVSSHHSNTVSTSRIISHVPSRSCQPCSPITQNGKLRLEKGKDSNNCGCVLCTYQALG